MENKNRLIEIPSDGIIRIPTMCGNDTVGEKRIDLSHYPTVDTVEVVHGRWVPVGTYEVCSHCGFEINRGERIREFFLVDNQHCRWCGAKMDGDGNGDD